MHIVKSLADSVRSFTDPLRQKETLELLYSSMSPLTDSYLQREDGEEEKPTLSKKHLNEVNN